MRKLNKKEAALIKEYEQEKAAEKVKAKLLNDIVNTVFEGFEDKFKKFDWVDERIVVREFLNDPILNGTVYVDKNERHRAYKGRMAIAELVKIALRAKNTAAITDDKVDKATRLTTAILEVVLKEIAA